MAKWNKDDSINEASKNNKFLNLIDDYKLKPRKEFSFEDLLNKVLISIAIGFLSLIAILILSSMWSFLMYMFEVGFKQAMIELLVGIAILVFIGVVVKSL